MNMNKALQNLYHAVSGSTTTKVNISKLLVDIHQAITSKESPNKNNWAKIINSMADNWPGGGGGSSDFSTATVTVRLKTLGIIVLPIQYVDDVTEGIIATPATSGNTTIVLYKGLAIGSVLGDGFNVSVSGNANYDSLTGQIFITGDCTITIS